MVSSAYLTTLKNCPRMAVAQWPWPETKGLRKLQVWEPSWSSSKKPRRRRISGGVLRLGSQGEWL